MKGLWRRIGEKSTLRIGIYALTPGCGTTHLALSLANYLASKERRRVLFVECRDEGEGIVFLRTKQTTSVGAICGFTRDGVDYLPSCTAEDVRRLLSEKYDAILVEMSGQRRECVLMSGMFERRIYVFCAKPWKHPVLQKTLQQIITLKTEIPQGDCASFGLTKAEERMVQAEYGLHCREIPFIRDPFCLKKEDLEFLKTLLGNRRR